MFHFNYDKLTCFLSPGGGDNFFSWTILCNFINCITVRCKTISYSCWIHHFFTFLHILYEKKVLELWELPTSDFWRIYMFWDVVNGISLFFQNVCLYVTQILWVRWPKNKWTKMHGILHLVYISHKLVLVIFWCISLKSFRCCSKFSISLT